MWIVKPAHDQNDRVSVYSTYFHRELFDLVLEPYDPPYI